VPLDLAVGRWILWSQADEREGVVKTLLALCDPAAGEVLSLEGKLADLQREGEEIKQAPADKQDKIRLGLIRKANGLKREATQLVNSGQAEEYFYRLDDISNKSQDLVDKVGRGEL
jgi:hypothetical protein